MISRTIARKFAVIILMTLSLQVAARDNKEFDFYQFFTTERLRIDLIFAGDANDQELFLSGMYREPVWSGPRKWLAEPFNYGEYRYDVYSESGELLMRKGFNTLFQEWRTTSEAKKTRRSFTGSYWIPFPKDTVKVIFYQREKSDGSYSELLTLTINPLDQSINSEQQNDYKLVPVMMNGDPAVKVDLLFIAEGYTEAQMGKFLADVEKFSGYLFNTEPYKSRKNDFNIWALCAVSKESGTDIPHQNVWKNTALSSNFFTFGIDRYLTAPDHTTIASAAYGAPCDLMYVIVNTSKYGGGGIYNFYGLSMSDHLNEAPVFVHELGHAFAGLADEYYSSQVAYEDFYDLSCEPWEPNITTKIDFKSKWADMLGKDSVGLYEGGGYMAKGIFRPMENCKMKSNNAPAFCPVCIRAINRMIDFYTK
jgi:hypothetical protein